MPASPVKRISAILEQQTHSKCLAGGMVKTWRFFHPEFAFLEGHFAVTRLSGLVAWELVLQSGFSYGALRWAAWKRSPVFTNHTCLRYGIEVWWRLCLNSTKLDAVGN